MTTRPTVRIAAAIVALSACLSSALADPLPAETAQSTSAGHAEPAAPKNLPQVTIKAQRPGLELRVHAFVSHITTSLVADNDSLTRWHLPICPLVAGLPAEQGEAVLTRLSQIAAAADAKSRLCRHLREQRGYRALAVGAGDAGNGRTRFAREQFDVADRVQAAIARRIEEGAACRNAR